MTKTFTIAAVAALISTSAFAMVPSNDSIRADIASLGYTAEEVALIPADQLPGLNVALSSGDDSDARQAVRGAVASILFDGGVSAEEFAAWDANNGENSGRGLVAGVDFERNAFNGTVPFITGGGSEAN
ncbi:MAG: hypothetical protein AAF198_00015 [Pseudomonadota bacterium]